MVYLIIKCHDLASSFFSSILDNNGPQNSEIDNDALDEHMQSDTPDWYNILE